MTAQSPTSDAAHPSLWLFGATSTVGRHLLPLLRARRFAVTAFTRAAIPAWHDLHPEVDWMQCSLADAPAAASSTTHILSLGPCDGFVGWLARQAPNPALRQVIAFGSTSADTKVDSDSDAERALALSLRQSEALLAAHAARLGAAWTLLRPTLIYGGDTDLVARIQRFAARWHVYPRPLGAAARALRQPVHAGDLAAAVIQSIDNPAAQDRRFDLAGDQSLPLADLIRLAARAGSRVALPLPLPLSTLLQLADVIAATPVGSALDRSASMRIGRNQVFDIAPARAALGFNPRPFAPGSR
jgi:nucleoside-diphosphate-sugar epimerase